MQTLININLNPPEFLGYLIRLLKAGFPYSFCLEGLLEPLKLIKVQSLGMYYVSITP